ncbi:uncharacterized protein LOC111277716 isoform X1 [Durio zibethinus]|uniref:Uncharacterized protein LOC111277716 isoform X1 n=1 Tax=Durio zibethinus TaxID=66656 RepID=A0A6P5WUN5_DURZI|nr:uncharacterized protein LOC111277716 isoform X1 [Durio zibethinus]
MWSPGNKGAYPRRISAKARGSSIQENNSMHEASMSDEDITSIKDLLDAVVPFDILLDWRKYSFLIILEEVQRWNQNRRLCRMLELLWHLLLFARRHLRGICSYQFRMFCSLIMSFCCLFLIKLFWFYLLVLIPVHVRATIVSLVISCRCRKIGVTINVCVSTFGCFAS